METIVDEARPVSLAPKLNWLRAGVLGANDGIVSVAGLVMGVAGATTDNFALLVAGLAGLIAGALSMAGGEYVSVSSQRDAERAALAKLSLALKVRPAEELEALASAYRQRGISDELSHQVARELSERDALAAHAEAELGISADENTSPWAAAVASAIAFTVGAIVPLIMMLAAPPQYRVASTVVGVLVALAATGLLSAKLSGSQIARPIVRNLVVGTLAMGLTYLAGALVGA